VLGEESWTYAQLWEQAGRMAGVLRERQEADSPVAAVFASRSVTA
jgi:hypothetical protein